MGKGHQYTSDEVTSDEVTAQCMAWKKTTMAVVKGQCKPTDQKREDLIEQFLNHLKDQVPSSFWKGTYHKHGEASWAHLTKETFKNIHKFDRALRIAVVRI